MPRALDHWALPLVFIVLLPLVTGPATMEIREVLCASSPRGGIGEWSWVVCPMPLVAVALAPGLIGLATLFWFRSSSPEVRQAATAATALIVIRIAAPALDSITHGAAIPVSGFSVEGFGGMFGLALWFLTLEALLTHPLWGRPRRPASPEEIAMIGMGLVLLCLVAGVLGWIFLWPRPTYLKSP